MKNANKKLLSSLYLVVVATTEEFLVVRRRGSVNKVIEVLDLDKPQQVGVVDVERRFSKQESSKISLILELLTEFGVHGVNRVSSQKVVRPEREGSLGIGNSEVLPFSEILGHITVEDEEEGE